MCEITSRTLVSSARAKMKTNQTKAKEYNIMNIKVLVTLKLSVPYF